MLVALIRHPAPDVAAGVCYGRLDLPLHRSAGPDLRRLAVAALPPGPIWCSPSRRCQDTAVAIADGRAIVPDCRLLELNFGAWEGQRWDDIPRAALDAWAADPWHFAPPGGEPAAALAARVAEFHGVLRAEGRDCVVVSHGGPLKFLAALLAGLALDPLAPAQPLGSLHRVEAGMDDPHNLQRFLDAQAPVFDQVLRELGRGRKTSHWMWFIFPQLAGLGHSDMARRYAIADQAEAAAYIAHPVLGPRLVQCTELVLRAERVSVHAIFGSPDDLKFRSCMTLFASVAPEQPVFAAALGK